MLGVAARWEMIATRFKISRNKIEDFRKKFKRDSDQCLTAIIVEWLRAARGCSWRAVVCAIAARVGGDNPREAEKVAQEYKSEHRSCIAHHSIELCALFCRLSGIVECCIRSCC